MQVPAHTGFAGLVQDENWRRPRGWAHPERLNDPVTNLPGVGPTLAKRLVPLGIQTVGDLLYRRPRRYETAADQIPIGSLNTTDEVVIAGTVGDIRTRVLPRRRSLVTARITDETGTISATWFNQPWVAERLRPGMPVRLRGKTGRYGFDVKTYDLGDDAAKATADFAPVYGASEHVSPARLRELTRTAVENHIYDVLDPLPAELDLDRKSTRLNSSHIPLSRMPSSA